MVVTPPEDREEDEIVPRLQEGVSTGSYQEDVEMVSRDRLKSIDSPLNHPNWVMISQTVAFIYLLYHRIPISPPVVTSTDFHSDPTEMNKNGKSAGTDLGTFLSSCLLKIHRPAVPFLCPALPAPWL